MNDDEYELAELMAQRKQDKKNNRYWAQNDPEAPELEPEGYDEMD